MSSNTKKKATTDSKGKFGWIGIVVFITVVVVVSLTWAMWRSSEERYEISGKVVSLDLEKKRVTVDHEEIKGYMDAMTMPFPVRDERMLAEMESGDSVKGTLVIDGDRYWLEGIEIVQKAERVQQADRSPVP